MDMRDAFFASLYKIIEKDKNVYLVTPDHGAFGVDKIRQDFPDQYLNVGIAEQNTISIAAGLALSGKIVYIYGIINFIILRCLEQINIDIASMNLHINIVGVGAGFTYSTDGPTHHGTQDIAMMSAIPNFKIYNCSDAINTNAFAKIGYEEKGPKYIRIEKGELPKLYTTPFENNGISRVINGDETTIVSSGRMVHRAIGVSNQLLDLGKKVNVLDVYQLKPFQSDAFVELIGGSRLLVILEDNVANGGLADKVCSALVDYGLTLKVLKLNVDDAFCFEYSIDRNWVEQQAIGREFLI